jgi:predicted dehydrogenase
MMKKIGVAVIGASPIRPGWAVKAHLPAIQALPDFELRAVGTSDALSAMEAAKAFGVPAFDNAQDVITYPGIDLVVIAVKVTHHHTLISQALAARKMVLSEWPLGVNLDEAADLASRAEKAGVRTAIGLQARFAPAIRHARDLIASGYLGEVLGTSLIGSGMAWGGVTDRAHAYMFDMSQGASLLSVTVLHALDALHHLLGEFTSLVATAAVRRPTVYVVEDGSRIPVSAPDHVAISGTLAGGVAGSVFYRGGVSRGQNLRWEINGTEGDLVLSSHVGNLQVADLLLEGGRGEEAAVRPIDLPEAYATAPGGLSGAAEANVLRLYAQLARDIREGTQVVPGFSHALIRHRELAQIEIAAGMGIPAPRR